MTELGTSIWLDQIRRSLVESGELRRMVEEDSPARPDVQSGDLREGDPGLHDYDEQIEQLANGRRDRARRSTGRSRSRTCRTAADVLRPVFDELDRVDGYVSLEVDPDLALRHRAHARPGARVLGARRPAEPHDQDPRHGRGPAGDRAGALRGHQRQRDAAVRRRRLRRRSPRPTSRAWSAATPTGKGLDVHSVALVLRLARRHRGRQATGAARPQRTSQGQAGLANARAAYRRFEELFYGASVRRPARGGRARPAPAVGLDRA